MLTGGHERQKEYQELSGSTENKPEIIVPGPQTTYYLQFWPAQLGRVQRKMTKLMGALEIQAVQTMIFHFGKGTTMYEDDMLI